MLNSDILMQYADQRYRDQCDEIEMNSGGRESQDASQIEITGT